MKLRSLAVALVAAANLSPIAASAQPARERELTSAIAPAPADVERYVALAEFYATDKRLDAADRVLRDALTLDPLSRTIFEKRILLFAEPLQPSRIGAVALEWLGVDGTYVVPVLLASGYRLRRASSRRGDGSRASLTDIDLALEEVIGALPANPDSPALLLVRSLLLEARSTLVTDPAEQRTAQDDALAIQRRARALQAAEDAVMPGGALSPLVAAMMVMPPFGPPGAIREGNTVPRPRRLNHVMPRGRHVRPDTRRAFLRLEVIVSPEGHVMHIHPLDSLDGYDDAMAASIRQWVYEPTIVDGVAVPVILTVAIPINR